MVKNSRSTGMPSARPPGGPLPGSPGISHRVRHHWLLLPRHAQPLRAHGGLEAGFLHPPGTGPVPGPAQLAVLSATGAIIVAAPFVVRRRRAAARSCGQH
jgi:hypothetical protein